MSDNNRTFIDTNIFLYLFADDESRKETVLSLFSERYMISTQIVNENVNVCLRKLKLSKEIAFAHGKELLNKFIVVNIYSSTITTSFEISSKYGYGYWDSLVIASALENDCNILFTEDLHTGQLIEGKLKIVNPFIRKL
jgi:predicted nucleic acid-binding protein